MSTNCFIRSFLFLILSLSVFGARGQEASPPSKTPPFQFHQGDETPFWRKNKRVRKRVFKDREILVSVNSETFEKELLAPPQAHFSLEKRTTPLPKQQKRIVKMKRLHLRGAGLVDTDLGVARQQIKKFSQLKKLAPDNFIEIRENDDRVFIHGVAMKWHAKMHMRVFEQSVSEGLSRLHFLIVRGAFAGMRGYIELHKIESVQGVQLSSASHQNIEFSMTAVYEAEKLPLPSFLLSFGLETVMKIVAKKLRKHLEGDALIGREKNV